MMTSTSCQLLGPWWWCGVSGADALAVFPLVGAGAGALDDEGCAASRWLPSGDRTSLQEAAAPCSVAVLSARKQRGGVEVQKRVQCRRGLCLTHCAKHKRGSALPGITCCLITMLRRRLPNY